MKMVLPVLADLANGVFAVVIAAFVTSTEIVWWHYIVGILFAMSPDIDALPELLQRGKVAASDEHYGDHRDGLHYPLLWLVGGGVATYFFGFFGMVFLIASMLHYINDFYGTGWGIKLLWPITNRSYKLLGRRVNRLKQILVENGDWEKLNTEERKLRLVVSWSSDESSDYISKWGIDDWIKPYYLRLNWISGIEYILFFVALLVMIFSLIY